MNKIIECVPNFSEGRNIKVVEQIASAFKTKKGVKLLNYSNDIDHNRMVVTAVGEPLALKKAILEAVNIAVNLIDLNVHKGEHPRMGAVDVIPFIPIKGCTMDDAVKYSKTIGSEIAKQFSLPVFLYEKSASNTLRENLSNIRKGEFEGFDAKIQLPEWKPDYGPQKKHPTAGVVAVGARKPLIAFNVNLATDNITIANNIAKKIRHSGGGLRYCKAIGIELKQKGTVQVSMNLTDYTKTSIYQAFELVKAEVERYGISITGSEVIGLIPFEALVDASSYYLRLENFSVTQTLEYQLYN